MIKSSFNDNWKCYRTNDKSSVMNVELPHDAMLLDAKSETSPGGVNTGWYDTNDYTYEKTFIVTNEQKGQNVVLEFEGVYHKATVYVNGSKVTYHDYGYTGFYIDITKYLLRGQSNTIQLEVINHDQPNSRWYSGSGIYRPVWMYLLGDKHIELEGIRISTLEYKQPQIKVQVKTTASGNIKVEILDDSTCIASTEGETDGTFEQELIIPQGQLWSESNPKLYTCRVTYEDDVQEERFGIRLISCDSQSGLCINGKRVILRGACIHHDNGILGACAYDFAEMRKVRILKENGYNAIRSAHNPCSKAMLRACDELGVYIMDEYVDVWYIHKTKYDYASMVEENYRKDLKGIVSKDYNHPSVILYSTGNEVSESAKERGIKLCGEMTSYLHELDDSRPVTCGINIFFNFLSSMGFGVYSDKKADQAVENKQKKKSVGSEFFNKLAGIAGAEFMKLGATLYPCDVKTRDSFANMDVAGYNYGIRRYIHDLKKYPNRLILGSETFCADAYEFWEIAKKEKRIIGDFVWAGMDYLGEVGIGSWEYQDYAPRFDNGLGWVSAGSGRIDLTGKALSEMEYTQVAFEQKDIAIGVVPVPHTHQKHSPSAWKMTNAMESWSWDGCENMDANVEVYCRAHHIALFVNGTIVGTKKTNKNCNVKFHTKYHSGDLKAIGYDKNNTKIAEKILRSADTETILTAEVENEVIRDNQDLCYIRYRYTDKNRTLKPLARGEIKLHITGGKLLGFGSACPYYPKSYQSDIADTYYGEALAIVKPEGSEEITICAVSAYGNCITKVKVIS
jgi:beta-galactosidase